MKITCWHCQGKGTVPLKATLEETLKQLNGVPKTAREIAKAIGEEVPAIINNRLEILRKHGLATREMRTGGAFGRYFVYTRKERQK